MSQGVNYRVECNTCKSEGVKTHYHGESSRTAFDRGEEHLQALRRRDVEHPLWKHFQEHHLEEGGSGESTPDFKMVVTSSGNPPPQEAM